MKLNDVSKRRQMQLSEFNANCGTFKRDFCVSGDNLPCRQPSIILPKNLDMYGCDSKFSSPYALNKFQLQKIYL